MVLNLSQQTDSADLLGGFRPVQARDAVLPLLDRLCDLVQRTWTHGRNADFVARVAKLGQRRKWGALLAAMRTAISKVEDFVASSSLSVGLVMLCTLHC